MNIYSKSKRSRCVVLAALLLLIYSVAANADQQVTYYHHDLLGSPIAASDVDGNLLWRQDYRPFGRTLNTPDVQTGNDINYTGHQRDDETGLVYMQARYYDPAIGRFYSNDPVGFVQSSPIHSFNRYAYANNNPYKFVDPNGELAFLAYFATPPGIATLQYTGSALVGIVAGAYLAEEVIQPAIDSSNGRGDPSAPALPDGLVGDQSDPRAGPNKSGNRHTSGKLTPENGGTGDFEEDLSTLAGETRPAGEGDSAPPGSQIGENGVFGRDNSSGGKSIDIPKSGDKPHETLHYELI